MHFDARPSWILDFVEVKHSIAITLLLSAGGLQLDVGLQFRARGTGMIKVAKFGTCRSYNHCLLMHENTGFVPEACHAFVSSDTFCTASPQ